MTLLPQLERDLLAAARQRPRLGAQRSVLLGALLTVVLAVPALAISGAFNHHRKDVISTLGGCSSRAAPQAPPTSTKPAGSDLLGILGALRRPVGPADALPSGPASPTSLRPNPHTTRLVRTDRDGTRYYLGTVDNLFYQPPVPNKPGCRLYRIQHQRLERRSEQGVCLFTFGRERGGTCATAAQISRGLTTGWGGGTDRHGVAHSFLTGIAPDGVSSVSVRLPRRPPLNLPVIGNVYAASLSGAAAEPLLHSQPRVFFHYADGTVRQVQPVPVPAAVRRRARRQARLVAERDRHASRVPAIYPPSGTPRKVFTLRVRVPLPTRSRQTYVITLRGPEPGNCGRELVFITAESPSSGPQHKPGPVHQHYGLLGYGFGAYNVSPGRQWCRGTYRGTVSFAPNGARRPPHRLVGRFSFRVR